MCNCKKRCYPSSGCPTRFDTSCVDYRGSDLVNIGVNRGDSLQESLIKIDTVIGAGGSIGLGQTTSLIFDPLTGLLSSTYPDGSTRTQALPQLIPVSLSTDSTDVTFLNQLLTLNKATQTTDGLLSKEDKVIIDSLSAGQALSLSTDVKNDLDNTTGLFLDVSQSNVTDTNNLVAGSIGGTTIVPLQSLINALSNIGGGVSITTTSQITNNGSDGTSTYVENDELGSAATANTTDFATAAQGVLATTAVQPASLATVATSGDYNDLINAPTGGTQNASQVPFAPTGNTTSTDVQAAIEELQVEIDNLPTTGGTLPTPTQNGTELVSVGGSYVEVETKRLRFTGLDTTNAGGIDFLLLPDTPLMEANGYIFDIVVTGQPRFLTDDYTFSAGNQIQFGFSIVPTDVIHVTYKVTI